MTKETLIRNNDSPDFVVFKLYLLSFCVAFVNAAFSTNRLIANAAILIELAALAFAWIRKKYVDYLGLYILFCGLSLEYSALLDTDRFYGFKNTRIMGVNLGILVLIPAMLRLLTHKVFIPKGKVNRFWGMFLALQASSFVMGLLMILFNDNGVDAYSNLIPQFIGEVYQICGQNIFLVAMFVVILGSRENIGRLEYYFEALLAGTVFSLVISSLVGAHGRYGGVKTLIATNNIRWIPLILLLPLYPQYRHSKRFWVIGAIGAVLLLLNNATGKTLMVYAVIPIAYIMYSAKYKRWKECLFWVACIPAIIAVGGIGMNYMAQNSVLFNSKLGQVKSVIDLVLGRQNVGAMRASPQNRIYEVMNITMEYFQKPYLLLLGKGFMGTVTNHVGMPYVAGGYTDAQWYTGLFYRMHESFSKLYLSGGLLGLTFFLKTIWEAIKNFFKSPWWLVGIYWFIISYGYSITMTAFGFPCLIYAMIVSDKKD